MTIRKSAIAGTWYPGTRDALTGAVDTCLAAAPAEANDRLDGELAALIAPHAGLMYSGPVAAHAYRLLRGRSFELAVLVGPSHFVGFRGAAVYGDGGFETPLGVAAIDGACATALTRCSSLIRDEPRVHAREHSLEMQLPFLQRLAPGMPIVPLLMGDQTADTIRAVADAVRTTLEGRRALIVASSDLSHYQDATTASRLDATVIDCVARFDADGLQRALDAEPGHACGGGPMVAVLQAARQLGARNSRVLHYADSGDVTGDKTSVVGYMAAAVGTFAA